MSRVIRPTVIRAGVRARGAARVEIIHRFLCKAREESESGVSVRVVPWGMRREAGRQNGAEGWGSARRVMMPHN